MSALDTPAPPHRCYRQAHCRDTETVNNKRLGAAINAERGLCPTCTRHLDLALGQLPADYVELSLLLGRHTRNVGPYITATKELPIPIRVGVEALMRAVDDETSCWAESVAEVLRVTWDTQAQHASRPAVRVDRAARLLARAVPVLLALHSAVHPVWDGDQLTPTDRDGLDGALVFIDLHRRARAVTGQSRLTHRLPDPCPECDRTALQHPDGSDTVTCAGCSHTMTWDEHQDMSGVPAGSAA